jgi:DNA-directed RNA polymerase subunit M/transcription elongation factor TFIIS
MASRRENEQYTPYEKELIKQINSLNVDRTIIRDIKSFIQKCNDLGIDIETNYKYQNYTYELITTSFDSIDTFRQLYDLVMSSISEYKSPFEMVVEETNDLSNKNLVYSTEFYKKERKEEEEFNNSIRFGTNIEDGVYECPNCHSKKTVSQSKQTRASDEEIKAKIFCYSCKKTWAIGQIKIKKQEMKSE